MTTTKKKTKFARKKVAAKKKLTKKQCDKLYPQYSLIPYPDVEDQPDELDIKPILSSPKKYIVFCKDDYYDVYKYIIMSFIREPSWFVYKDYDGCLQFNNPHDHFEPIELDDQYAESLIPAGLNLADNFLVYELTPYIS